MAKKGVFGRIVFRPDCRHAVLTRRAEATRQAFLFLASGQGIFLQA